MAEDVVLWEQQWLRDTLGRAKKKLFKYYSDKISYSDKNALFDVIA